MADIRNVALVGHGDGGKTTLAEAALFLAKAIPRRGTVLEGTTTADTDPEEKDRKSSVSLAVLHATWKGVHLNLLDAPGYPDFLGEAVAALAVVETAVLAIPATHGIQVNTRRCWALAEERGLARVIVLTKADHEQARVDEVLTSIRETFGARCVPAVVPVGAGPKLTKVVAAWGPADGLPADVAKAQKAAGDALTEQVVEADDALLERYLGGETIPPAELGKAFAAAVAQGKVVPVFVVASEKDIGVREWLDALATACPSPATGVKRAGVKPGTTDAVTLAPAPESPPSAFVFRVVSDPYVGRVAYLRIVSGALAAETALVNARTGKAERIPAVQRVQGKDTVPIPKAEAGDIVAVAKVETLQRDDTIHAPAAPVQYPATPYPHPTAELAVEPKNRGDEAKVSVALTKLADEDPAYAWRRDPVTKETLIAGLSQLHLDVLLRRAQRRSKVEFATRLPRIAYRETISVKAEAKYRHKKQTGGSGQFAEVWLRIAPLQRGAGFVFEDGTVGGTIPKQYLPSCEKGIRGVLDGGAVAGYPVVDIMAEVYDGKDHPVDSKDIAFQIAARKAFKEAIRGAKPVLLEPIMDLEVTVPSKFMGDITSDVNGRRGRIVGMDSAGDLQIVRAQVPAAQVQSYSSELRSLTGGEGAYTLKYSHYDVVPAQIAQAVIAQAAAAMKAEDEKDS